MAYSTGTVAGMKNLFDAIVAFALANGWTLYDTLSNTDKVLRSTGVSGNRNLIYRLQAQPRYLDLSGVSGTFAVGDTVTGGTSGDTATVTAVAPTRLTLVDNNGMFQAGETLSAAPSGASATVVSRVSYDTILAPDAIQNAADHIIARGYNAWNTVTNVGTNEYSRYGKLNLTYARSNSPRSMFAVPGAANIIGYIAPLRGFSEDTYVFSPPAAPSNYDLQSQFYGTNQFDGRRAILSPNAGSWGGRQINYDLAGATITSSTGWPYFNPVAGQRGLCLVFDKQNDNWTRYIDQRDPSIPAPNSWQQWSWNTDTWSPRASAVAAGYGASGNFTKLCWDGDDYVYMLNGAGSVQLTRYKVSTNSWDAPGTLANCPSANNFNVVGTTSMWYIPKEAIVAGTSDEVWVWPSNTSTIYRYNVSADSWSSLAMPFAQNFDATLAWDNERYFYLQWSGSSIIKRLDLQSLSGWPDWTSNIENTDQFNQFVPFNQFAGNIRGLAQQSIKYWLLGDADTITVVTKVVDHYYWSQFGMADTFYSDAVATLTAPATAGSPATITVDSTSGLTQNQEVLAFDPATGNYTKFAVYQISSPTTFTAFLTSNLASGSQVSTDHNCSLVASDAHFASMACDGSGYGTQAPDLQPSYRITPGELPNWLPRGGPTTRQAWQMWPLIVFQNFPAIETYENRASLRHIKVTRRVAGGPTSEDLLKIDGQTYLTFFPENYKYTLDSNYMLVFGPI